MLRADHMALPEYKDKWNRVLLETLNTNSCPSRSKVRVRNRSRTPSLTPSCKVLKQKNPNLFITSITIGILNCRGITSIWYIYSIFETTIALEMVGLQKSHYSNCLDAVSFENVFHNSIKLLRSRTGQSNKKAVVVLLIN